MGYKFNNIQGWMSNEELEWLYNKATEMQSIVEIGSWRGRSTHALLSGCPGIVFSVDHWLGNENERSGAHKEATEQDIYAQFMNNVGHFKNLCVLRGESRDQAPLFYDKTVDMCFIDGCHMYNYVKEDITLWLPKTIKIICGHDCGQDGVPAAINEIFPNKWKQVAGTIWCVELL